MPRILRHSRLFITATAAVLFSVSSVFAAPDLPWLQMKSHFDSFFASAASPAIAVASFDGPCPVIDPNDIWYIHTCLRPVTSTDIPLGTTKAFYFETYVETGGFFFFNDYYSVTTFDGKAQIAASVNGPFTTSISLPISRDHFSGYARSPNFFVKGTTTGADLLWAFTQLHNSGNTLPINITSAPPPPPPPTPTPTPTPPPPPPPPPPPTPDLQFINDIFFLGVGSIRPIQLEVSNGEPNSTGVIHVQLSTGAVNAISISLNQTGTFTTSLGVPIQIDSNGYGLTAPFFLRGDQSAVSSEIFVKAEFQFPSGIEQDILNVRVVNIASIAFQSNPQNVPLDDNPNAGHGLRIFPEKKTADDSAFKLRTRKEVTVQAQLSYPRAGITILFMVFDVDDPSTDDPIIDKFGPKGNDNRGGFGLFHTTAVTDADGKASVVLRVSTRPGDNYRVAATCESKPDLDINNYLSEVQIDGIDLREKDGNLVPTSTAGSKRVGIATPMLTTWRRLHIERDSMGVVPDVGGQKNFISGKVLSVVTLSPTTSRLVVDSTLDAGRFAGGRVILIHPHDNSFTITAKVGKNSVTNIVTTEPVPERLVGYNFIIYDDDDFNGDDGENLIGDTGEDIPPPDMSFLQDSDDPAVNKLAPAYVRPTYDLAGEDDDVPFVLNTLKADPSTANPTLAELLAIYKFDNIATENDPDFWTVYVLNAYQDLITRDHDTSSEDAVMGRADGIGNGRGLQLFVETAADYERYAASAGITLGFCDRLSGTVVHELGHLFGGNHPDGGVMDGIGSDYSAKTLAKIRTILNP